MANYFITGATGTVGSEAVKALLSKGEHVTAATRQVERSKDLFGDKVTSVQFDFQDQRTYSQVKGADGVFIIGPPINPQLFELVSPFLDYVEKSEIGRVVYLSANGMQDLPELPFHGQMEGKIKSSKLDWTILRPGFFMQNFSNYERENIELRKIIFSPAGDGKTAFISSRDIGEAIAAVLTGKGHKGQTYTLTGKKPYSYQDAADLLSAVLGESITYPNPDVSMYRNVLQDSGVPDFIADYMIPIYGMIREGKVDNTSADLEKLIQREPENLKEVLQRDFGK